MRARLSAIVATAIGSACATAEAGPGPKDGGVLCGLVDRQVGGTSIHFASRDVLSAAVGPGGLGGAICAGDDPGCTAGAVFVYRDRDGDGEHSLVVSGDAGLNTFEGYPGLFVAGAGRCAGGQCAWEPETTVRGSPTWLVVRHAGEAARCQGRTCHSEGVLAQFAVVARASGRLAFVIRCEQSERAQLIVSGEQFVLMACEGTDVTFGGRALLGCFGP